MRKVFICPGKYIQGENELENLGFFVKQYGNSALLIGSKEDIDRIQDVLKKTADKFAIKFISSDFSGECSNDEIIRLQKVAKENNCDCTIGLGGGKAIDTAKCVSECKDIIIAPTIAATDAPTSHLSVVYTPSGEFEEYRFFKRNPDIVLMDTKVIANAPTRFLVSGMGDALATYFEARATNKSYSEVMAGIMCSDDSFANKDSKSTLTANTLGKLCYKTLLRDGYNAKVACEVNQVTSALENIIEANTLLSGLGFESGGLAAAHAIHNGLTAIDETHKYYHGEKVAFSTIAQLVLENSPETELYEVIDFCLSVGLPVCLADIGIKSYKEDDIKKVAEKACDAGETIHNMPFKVTVDSVTAAIITADKLGSEYKKEVIG